MQRIHYLRPWAIALSLLAFASCQQDELAPPPGPDRSVELQNRDRGQGGATLSESETRQAYAYLDETWANIQAWRKGRTGTSNEIEPARAAYAFEGIVNVNAGDLTQRFYERTTLYDSVSVPDASRATWSGTQAAAVYGDVVRRVNRSVSAGPGSKNRLVFVDLEPAKDDPFKWYVSTVVEAAEGTPLSTYAQPVSFDIVWGPEAAIVPPVSQQPTPCVTQLTAVDIIQSEVTSELAVNYMPLAIGLGIVATNPGGPFGGPFGPPQGLPVFYDTSTYAFPTGSGNFEVRGEFMTHSDFGREEICFEDIKVTNYADDGEQLATDLQSVVPPAVIFIGPFAILRPRRPFSANYVPGTKTVQIDEVPGGPVFGTERFHDVGSRYGARPFFIFPAPEIKVLAE